MPRSMRDTGPRGDGTPFPPRGPPPRRRAGQVLRPASQCLGIVAADVLQVDDPQIRSPGQAGGERAHRGKAAAGKHHASHEVLVTFGPLEAAVVDDDCLDGGQPVFDKQIGTLGQEPIVPAPVHRLDHLDRDQLVEPAAEVAPVLAEHRDAVGKAGVGHPLLDIGALGVRDGGGGHPAPVAGGGVDGQPAPARADLD